MQKSESSLVKKPLQQQTQQSLKPAAVPTSRLRAPFSKSTSDVVKPASKGPMKATTSQSSTSLPRSNLRLASGSTRKNTASTGL